VASRVECPTKLVNLRCGQLNNDLIQARRLIDRLFKVERSSQFWQNTQIIFKIYNCQQRFFLVKLQGVQAIGIFKKYKLTCKPCVSLSFVNFTTKNT